jgi:hypothetical protein
MDGNASEPAAVGWFRVFRVFRGYSV